MTNNDIYRLGIVLSFFFILVSCSNKKKGDLDSVSGGKTIIETGELDAVNSIAFTTPRSRYWFEMRVIGILEHGTIVQPGDSIIQFDPTEANKMIVDMETRLETQLANFEKLQVDQANMINELVSNFKNAQATFNLRKISLEASNFESERTKKIRALEFEQDKINLAKEERKIELRKIINENDLKIQGIRINQLKKTIDAIRETKNDLTLRTQHGGVFQIAMNWRSGTMIKNGDIVYSNNPLAKVPDLEFMKVNTFINENDFLKIYLGQKVAVRLDAMPNVVFDGEVNYIGKLCRLRNPNSRQKVFDVVVNITEPNQRLKPGMTVSCEFLNCR